MAKEKRRRYMSEEKAKPSTQQWVPVTTATAIDMRKSMGFAPL